MRKFLIAATAALLAGCGANPTPVVVATAPPAPVVSERGDLIGLDAGALLARFGTPQLQVREGDGTKLQFARGGCILDAYLYPATSGAGPRVAHIDTRNRDGRSVDQASCVAAIAR